MDRNELEINIEHLDGLDLLYAVALNAGFKGHYLYVAIAIAIAESSMNPLAEGDIKLQTEKWGPSVGLWQIRSLKNPEKYNFPDNHRIYEKLFNPQFNADVAFSISLGFNFSAWSTFTNNKYREFINEVINYHEIFINKYLS